MGTTFELRNKLLISAPTESRTMRNLLLFSVIFFLPAAVSAGGTCELGAEADGDRSLALKYKLSAIAAILAAGAAGVCLPAAGRRFPALSPDKNVYFVVKAFAAGVILATGFIHVLPDAFESLTSPCVPDHPWGDFPFTGFVAMAAAIGTLMVDAFATSYYGRRSSEEEEERGLPVHTHATHGHAHGSMEVADCVSDKTELRRHRVISQVLELGIIVHSIIIGIALGASQSPDTIRPLIAALAFHQFFEGIGLGGCITQAKFNFRTTALMIIFFSMTTPSGIAIGIGITNFYSETNAATLIVEGIFNAASAGILIYMALVDLLSADFMSTRMQSNGKLQLAANASLLVGAGCMSLVAKWA